LAQPVSIDGDFSDWESIPEAIVDATGDGATSAGDFLRIKVANDAYNLYLMVEFASPLNLRIADLTLYIDADNDPLTGIPLNDRGMDFVWDFDRNRGTGSLLSRSDIGRGNLIQRIAPDGASTQHEFAVSLAALPAAAAGEPVHLQLVEENSGDRIPDMGTELFHLATGPLAIQPIPLTTAKDWGTIRIVSWNVLRDAPFESSSNRAAFLRVMTALRPDILLLQEVYDTPTQEILDLFAQNLQLPAGSEWQAARRTDCITISRFPITGSWPVNGNLVSRQQTAEAIGVDLLIGNAHFPCCENESGRIQESAAMISVLGDRLLEETARPQSLIIGGDLNSGGLAPELVLLSNAIVPLEMASPRHLYTNDQYTWGSRGSSFGSSRLDFILFDPTTLFRQKAFILDTDLVPVEALSTLGLSSRDTFVSDHLPLVMDVRSPRLPGFLVAQPMAADGSTTSAWFGAFNAFNYPQIEHERLGSLTVAEGDDRYWFGMASGGWLWTDPETYPWVYVPNFD
jgi:endonuclease/exonuclease/phosphatase family metal-dependent hydrolase